MNSRLATPFLFLTLLLSACASGPVKTQIEYVRPPAGYFAPCAVPQPENGQLGYLALEYTLMLQEALAKCNDQNRAGREWLSSQDD